MSVTIDLPADIEASLTAEASTYGIPLAEHVRHILEERAVKPRKERPSPSERAQYWQDTAGGLRGTKPLSVEAVSREAIYAGRG